MSLSSLIVQREVATMRHVEEALARQVIYGGDFATNLLEVASVDEGALTQLIAETMGLAQAPPGELPVTPETARLVPKELAIAQGILPLGLNGEVLVLAVAEPIPAELEGHLIFTLGLAIDQRVATAVRIRQALARLYGAPLDRRTQVLLARLSGAPPPAPERTGTGTPPLGFARTNLPQRSDGAAADSSTATGSMPPRVQTLSLGFPSGPPGRTAPTPAPTLASVDASPDSGPLTTRAAVPVRRAGLLQRDVPPGARSARRRRGPIPFDSAKREAEDASDRNALLDLFFDFSRQFFDYAALFLVHGDIAEGRDAFGAGANRERVVGIGVPLDLPSLMTTARDQRTAVVGIGSPDGLDAVLLADLQRPLDAEMAIVPLVVRSRVVAMLLGDCGDAGTDRPDLKQVTTFAGIVGKALERIIVRRKLEGFIAAPRLRPSGGVQRVDVVTVPARPPSEAMQRAVTVPARPSSEAMQRAVTVPAPAKGAVEQADSPTLPTLPTEAMQPPDAPTSDPPESPGPTRGLTRLITTSMMPPPPPNVVTVRRMTGPPIPREEPDSRGNGGVAPSTPGPQQERAADRDSDEPGEAAGADGSADAPRAETGIPQDLDARALFDMLGWETGTEEPERPPPSSALAVPPHRPPHGHVAPPEELPSIIVDLDQELAAMVDRIISGEADESAEGELLRQGERAMPVLMSRFPGPVTFERGRIESMPNPPRASDCGPILRLVARERKVALPFVLQRLSDPDPETRGWATHLLAELPYDAAIPHVLERLRDVDACTRASAQQALAAVAKVLPDLVREALKAFASVADPADRIAAIGAMAKLRQAALVPVLIASLADGDQHVVAAAHESLVQVTWQDFGSDARPWLTWWEENSSRHHIEWLIDALTHDVAEIRRAAGEELRATSREYFGYSSDVPPRDRERAQQRYRDWWSTEGRTRFRRR